MEAEIVETIALFDQLSKKGTGVHMFRFSKHGSPDIFIGSEVTDNNNVYDVIFKEWKKSYEAVTPENPAKGKKDFVRPKNDLREVWRPEHVFSSGRVAFVAVTHLLQTGYTMEEVKPN